MSSKNFSFSEKFVSGEANYGFWNVVAKGVGFANTFLVISSFSLYEYGVFQLLLATYGLVSDVNAVGGGPVGNDLHRFIEEGKEAKAKKLFNEYHGMRIVLGILLWAIFYFAGPSVLSIWYDENFISLLKTLSFLFLAETFLGTVKSLLIIRLNFVAYASRSAVAKFVQLVVLLLFLLYGNLGVRETIIAMIAGLVVSTFSLLAAARRAYAPWRRVQGFEGELLIPLFFRYGKWSMFRQLFARLTSRIQPWLIKIFIGTEAVGIYGVAATMSGVFKSFLPTNTLGTLIARRISAPKEHTRAIFVYGIKYMVLASMVMVVVAWIVVPPVVRVFFEKYTVSLPLFYLLMLELPIQPLWRMVDVFFVALRRQKFIFFRMVFRNVLITLLLLLLLPTIRIWGLAVVDVGVPLIIAVGSYFYLVRIKPSLRFDWRAIISFADGDRFVLRTLYQSFIRSLKKKFT